MSIAAIILAAGKGTRMNSDLPKVLHPVCGRPMLSYVIDACRGAGCNRLILVVGHKAELVRQTYADLSAGRDGLEIAYVLQEPQLGTGHAVMVCQEQLKGLSGPVLVVAGDGPLIHAETLKELICTHNSKQASCTLATSILADPARYGRIVRNSFDELDCIVEYLDATPAQRTICEVNVSLYCFDAEALRWALPKLTNHNAKGEYYITDLLAILRSSGHRLAAVASVPPEDVLSINTPAELDEVSRIMAARSRQ